MVREVQKVRQIVKGRAFHVQVKRRAPRSPHVPLKLAERKQKTDYRLQLVFYPLKVVRRPLKQPRAKHKRRAFVPPGYVEVVRRRTRAAVVLPG